MILARVLSAALVVATLVGASTAAAAPTSNSRSRAVATTGIVIDNTKVTFDVYGQRVDAHDGDLVQDVDGKVYAVGTAYGCGFTLNVESPYCGVRVYELSGSSWRPAGAVGGQYAFDHLTSDWQDACAPTGSFGCFNPHVARRPDGKWVMWLNVDGVGRGSTTEASYRVLVADSPRGPYVPTATPPTLAVDSGDGWLEHGAADITVDPWGVGWLSYTAIRQNPTPGKPSHVGVVERLDPTMTTGTGQHVILSAANRGSTPVEMPSLVRAPNGTWYVGYSDPAVPYGIGGTSVMEAPHPLGPWTSPRTLVADSCSGQFAGFATIGSARVLITDRWVQPSSGPGTGVVGNQSRATNYYGRVTFTATSGGATGLIDAHTCQGGWTL
jgi:hypothetical protein